MGRFSGAGTAGVASASTGSGTIGGCFATLAGSATNGYKLRRATLGVIATAAVPTSQQLSVQVFRFTAAPTGGTTVAAQQLDPNTAPAGSVFKTNNAAAFVAGTFAATPSFQVSFNTQSAVDLPWEQLEEWVSTLGTANGLAFFNQANVLPSSPQHLYTIALEWEE